MIQILQNSQSENYKILKKNILGEFFPWFYYDHTTDLAPEKDGHENIHQHECHDDTVEHE